MTGGEHAIDRPTHGPSRTTDRRVGELTHLVDALRHDIDEWRELIETMPQIVWITRPDGWHVHFNRQWMEFTGLTLDESLGHGWNPPFHPEDRPRAAARWKEATTTGEPYEIEYRLRRSDGVYHWMLGRAMPLRDATGTIVKWFGTCTDIEEFKEAQARIDGQARLLDLTSDAIVVHDLDHRILHWNRAAERVHGWSKEEAVGRTLGELIAPDIAQVEAAVAVLLEHGEWSGDLGYVDRVGTTVVLEGRWSLVRGDDGSPEAVLAVNTDVTERRAVEARLLAALEERATHDPLTGLANRSLLFDRLELHLRQRDRRPLAVAFIDLDGFKEINDQLGHRTGDEVLVHVADRLRGASRKSDIVARIGGDEFVVVGGVQDDAAAVRLGERLGRTVEGEVQVGGHAVAVSASVGVTFVAPDDRNGADEIVARADTAMYATKRQALRALGTLTP